MCGAFVVKLFTGSLLSRRPTSPAKEPRLLLGFRQPFHVVLAYAFLTTYQAYYLLDKIGPQG